MTSLRFVASVWPGPLEAQVRLLCRSIRHFGGAHRDAPITVFAALPVAVAGELRALGAEVQRLKRRRPELPMANKVFACAAAEARYDEDVIVFCDSDSVIVAEPAELELGPGVDAAVRPINGNAVASTGPGDALEPFWLGAYELSGVAPGPFVTPALGGPPIRAFWNSGLVAVRRSAGLLGAWRRVLVRLLDARHVPPGGRINQLDQVALSVALARDPAAVRVLDGRYNYPLPHRDRLPPPLNEARLEELVHVHYYRTLHQPGYLDGLPDDPVARWLAPQLPLAPVEYAHERKERYRLPS